MKLQRKLVRVHGSDRVKFLNDLLSIEVFDEMQLRYGALLSPQGKIITDLFIHSEQDAFLLDLPSSQFDSFIKKMSFYKLRADVHFDEDSRQVFQVAGEGDPRGNVGARLYEENVENSMSMDEYKLLRIQALVPEFDTDFLTNEAYLREWRFDEMRGVDYQKGCFVGQEIAARMRHKSELLKSVVRINSSHDLQTGQEIYCKEKVFGHVLTTCSNNALCFLRLKGLNIDACFILDDQNQKQNIAIDLNI